MKEFQKVPQTYEELQSSYDHLYKGWMGSHRNVNQTLKILKLLKPNPGEKIVDIGCGTGYLLDAAGEYQLKPFGIDLSRRALRISQEKNKLKPLVAQAAAENLPWPTGYFDHAVILGSLEHFLDPAQAIKETGRVLKPGGKAAILVPNSHHIRAIYNVYKFGEILSDDQDYERFATRTEWEHLFISNGLSVASVHKFDTGMARAHKKGREFFWFIYNVLFKIFGNSWIPLNLTYTFIFICQPSGDQ
ncbi:MAG: class I SAM-dependent methyltransferase [Candidatus Helarchaeota archaeon]|nr:class I SAM-dependent methyltransferase [Candidatus Helarchaeota archaeon]